MVGQQEVTNLELIPGLPEDYGEYIFLLNSGKIRQGYYDSFPCPNDGYAVRYAECEERSFYYLAESEVRGWFRA